MSETRDGRGYRCNHDKQQAIAEGYVAQFLEQLPSGRLTRQDIEDLAVPIFLKCYLHGQRNQQIRDADTARRQQRREPAA